MRCTITTRSTTLILGLTLVACSGGTGTAGTDGDTASPTTVTPTASASASASATLTGSASATGGETTDASTTGATSSASTGVDPSDPTTGEPKFDVGVEADLGSVEGSGCARMDLVFVQDISASMHEEKEHLQSNYDTFIQVLTDHINESNEFSSYRVGVTNSSMNNDYMGCTTTLGLNGSLFDKDGGCGIGPSPWIEGPSADAGAQFSCLAEKPHPPSGTDCGKEVPLEVIENFGDKLAPGLDNEGFYSVADNSLLVFVIITDEDEDDSSNTNPAQTRAYLDALAGGPERYGVIVIAGPGPGECQGQYGDADEATILKSFVDIVPNGVFGDLCQGDLAQTLKEGLEMMVTSCDLLPPPG